ncbi:hypothetical protein P4123_29305 [Pseudomonas aeruginosa]|nr:hypothetical protein [Pseudomonas aeruginosa]
MVGAGENPAVFRGQSGRGHRQSASCRRQRALRHPQPDPGGGLLNVGEQALLAELAERGVLPTGLALDQQVLDRLLQGDASEGAPPWRRWC